MSFHNVYQADVKSDLYGLSLSDGQVVTLWGDAVRGDIAPIVYLWDGSSSASDNFPEVIKPTGQVGNGRYVRQYPDQVKANWNESVATALSFIQNKPSSLVTVSAPSAANSITSGTPFQPRAGGACVISVQASLSGLLNVTGQVVIAMSSTSGGTYTDVVGPIRLLVAVALITADSDSGAIPVPAGWYVRVTYTGTGTATFGYTKWEV